LLEETEKARLASELHDGPMQKLALAQMQIDAAAVDDDADSNNEAAQQRITGVELMREAIAELRTLQFELSPPVLHKRGLSAALDWLSSNTRERWGIDLRYAVDAGLPTLSRQQSVILFQCARELVYNLIKHSGASSGMITLTADAEGLELTVEDNGRGFDAANRICADGTAGGYGLYSVHERLQLLGGQLEIQSDASGSLLLIRLPLPEQ
jgi:signal transduction histidine kinase